MRQKGVILLPIVIIIVLLGALGYFIFQNIQLKKTSESPTRSTTVPTVNFPEPSPTSNPISGWKTYTNTAYGYSIKFPPSWRTQLIAAGAGDQEAKSDSRHVDFFDPNIKTYNSTSGATKGMITIQYFDLLPEQFADIPYDYQIGNTKAIKEENVYYVKANKGILEIMVLLPQNKQDEQIFNQILSTFKFTQ